MTSKSLVRPLSLLAGLVLAVSVGACTDDDAAEVELDAPANGVQLSTPAFVVPAGTERQWCYWFKLPTDVDLDVVRFEIKFLTGSHHMNLFQTNQDVPDHDEECFKPADFSSPTNPNGYDLIIGSQSGDFEWKLPEGVAFKLKKHRQIMLQTHYVNASTQQTPINVGKVKINLHSQPDKSKITAHMGTMFANNVNIKIPPHEARGFSTTCGLAKSAKVAALTGHFHSRGKTFSVNLAPDGKTPAEEIYRSRDWAEPPFTVLDTPRELPANGALHYTCDFMNNTNEEIKFGPRVEVNEHCNLFAYFYPWEEEHTRYCF